MILEGVVLRRIQYFEQCSRRIPAPISAEFIDFVEHDHRIHRAGVAQSSNEPARQSTDISAAMTPYLGFIANASQRHPNKLPAGRARDGFTDRRLSCARRSDQRQNRARAAV